MTFETVFFYLLASVVVTAAVGVVTVRNPVHAVLLLVLAFFTTAMLWLTLEAEFLAVVLVLVYVGAVMVLFMFVVMMLDINVASMRAGFARYLPLGLIVAGLMIVQTVGVVGARYFGAEAVVRPEPAPADASNITELGTVLYTEYAYPFELAAAILLVAIIAAIALTLRKRPGTRHQDPTKQVSVRREDRVRIVKVESERR